MNNDVVRNTKMKLSENFPPQEVLIKIKYKNIIEIATNILKRQGLLTKWLNKLNQFLFFFPEAIAYAGTINSVGPPLLIMQAGRIA